MVIHHPPRKETLEDHGLNHAEYTLCGGGFPARLKNGTLVSAVTFSNLIISQTMSLSRRALESI